MAVNVIVHEQSPDQVMNIVRKLREQGLVQGRDFDFKYEPAQYDNDGWSQVTPKQTVFTFYAEKYSTMFILKYGSK